VFLRRIGFNKLLGLVLLSRFIFEWLYLGPSAGFWKGGCGGRSGRGLWISVPRGGFMISGYRRRIEKVGTGIVFLFYTLFNEIPTLVNIKFLFGCNLK